MVLFALHAHSLPAEQALCPLASYASQQLKRPAVKHQQHSTCSCPLEPACCLLWYDKAVVILPAWSAACRDPAVKDGPWRAIDAGLVKAAQEDAQAGAAAATAAAQVQQQGSSLVLLGQTSQQLAALAQSMGQPAYRGQQLADGILKGAKRIAGEACLQDNVHPVQLPGNGWGAPCSSLVGFCASLQHDEGMRVVRKCTCLAAARLLLKRRQ